MSCVPQFTREVSFGCVLEIINDFRSGSFNRDSIQKVFWLAGCGLEVLKSTPEIQSLESLDTAIDLLGESIPAGTLSVTAPSTSDWTTLLPIILEILRLWLESRKK